MKAKIEQLHHVSIAMLVTFFFKFVKPPNQRINKFA